PIRALLDAPVDAVFSSDAYGAELAARLGAEWVQVDPGRRHTPVSGTAIIAFALHSYTDSTTEIADAATTSVSLVAQYMLNRRWLENWFVWIAVDVTYVGLFLYKGLNITAALYLLFIGLCVIGYRGWARARARQGLTSGPAAGLPAPVSGVSTGA
ncbi:MAG: nicotinamide mononucleotide transporter, partial [Cryobacterium sp.]